MLFRSLGVSAVLAAVTVGLYMGWYTPELTNAETRLHGEAFWTILTFILNAALFALVDRTRGWSEVLDKPSSTSRRMASGRPGRSSC